MLFNLIDGKPPHLLTHTSHTHKRKNKRWPIKCLTSNDFVLALFAIIKTLDTLNGKIRAIFITPSKSQSKSARIFPLTQIQVRHFRAKNRS